MDILLQGTKPRTVSRSALGCAVVMHALSRSKDLKACLLFCVRLYERKLSGKFSGRS